MNNLQQSSLNEQVRLDEKYGYLEIPRERSFFEANGSKNEFRSIDKVIEFSNWKREQLKTK